MDAVPDPERAAENLNAYFAERPPNALHRVVIDALARGALNVVVTTNYDQCFESADAENRFDVVESEDDADRSPDRPLIVKLHGTAAHPAPRDLIFQLRQEALLPQWKRDLLRANVAGATVLVCGYSGLDFEVTPELFASSPERVVWNALSRNEVSPSVKAILRPQDSVLVGDMKVMIARLWADGPLNLTVPPNLAYPNIHVPTVDRSLWRTRVFNSMSYARAALHECESGPVVSHVERARALFHAGRYRDAASLYDEIAGNATSEAERIAALLEASDAWRTHGSLVRSVVRILIARRREQRLPAEQRNRVRALRLLKQSLLMRYPYRLAGKLRARFAQRPMRSITKRWIVEALRESRKRGDWYNAQQLVFWAERLGVALEAEWHHQFAMPSARAGYQKVGFVVAQAMALRDRASSGFLSRSDRDEARILLDDLTEMGALPEVWKLARVLDKAEPNSAVRERGRHAFRGCQYGALARGLALVGLLD